MGAYPSHLFYWTSGSESAMLCTRLWELFIAKNFCETSKLFQTFHTIFRKSEFQSYRIFYRKTFTPFKETDIGFSLLLIQSVPIAEYNGLRDLSCVVYLLRSLSSWLFIRVSSSWASYSLILDFMRQWTLGNVLEPKEKQQPHCRIKEESSLIWGFCL